MVLYVVECKHGHRMFFVFRILVLDCRVLTYMIMSRKRGSFNVGALMRTRKVANAQHEKIQAEEKIIAEQERDLLAKRAKLRRLDNKVSSFKH